MLTTLRLRPAIAKYLAVFRIQLANRLAYPTELAAQSVMILLFTFIFFQLWKAAYRTTGTGTIAGMTLQQTIWYLMLAETITLSRPRLNRDVSNSVKDGSIAYLLNKPYSYVLYLFAAGMGDSLVHSIFNLLAGGALVWWMAGPPPSPVGWPFVLVCMLLAWMLDFCFSTLVGLTAFVTEDNTAFEWIYQKIVFILGGLLIPLNFYPAWLRSIAEALPFASIVYGPARLFVDFSLARFAQTVGQQVLWLALMAALVVLAYRGSVRRLSINGG